jgi:hypothetical protein
MKKVLEAKTKSTMKLGSTQFTFAPGTIANSLIIEVKSNDTTAFKSVCATVNRWKVQKQAFKVNQDEFKLLKSKENEIMSFVSKLKDGDSCLLQFNDKHSGLLLFTVEPVSSKNLFNQVDTYLGRFIELEKVVEVKNEAKLELISDSFRSKEFLRKHGLREEDLKVETKSKLKLVFRGSRTVLERLDLQKLTRVFEVKGEFKVNPSTLTFVKYKLKTIKQMLKKRCHILLRYDFAERTLNYEIYSFDEELLARLANELVENFLKKVLVVCIDAKNATSFSLLEGLVKEWRANSKDDDEANENDEDDEEETNSFEGKLL